VHIDAVPLERVARAELFSKPAAPAAGELREASRRDQVRHIHLAQPEALAFARHKVDPLRRLVPALEVREHLV
jgi:hypothetical protein